MRIAYQTTVSVVLLATPCHLSSCTLTGRVDRHWFRRRHFSFYNIDYHSKYTSLTLYVVKLLVTRKHVFVLLVSLSASHCHSQ